MKRFTWLLIAVFALSLSAACGDKKDDKGGKKTDTTAKGDKGGGGGGAIDEAKAKVLATTIDVAGFKRVADRVMGKTAMPAYEAEAENAKGKKAFVSVTAQSCVACVPLDPEKWKANENLKAMLPTVHKDNPDLVWEVDAIEAGGVKGISVYSRSFHQSEDGKSKSSAHGMDVHYHNGVNQLVIQVSARGGSMATSADELKEQMSKEEFMEVAKKFLAAFGPKL